jgi:hypothetical protein
MSEAQWLSSRIERKGAAARVKRAYLEQGRKERCGLVGEE